MLLLKTDLRCRRASLASALLLLIILNAPSRADGPGEMAAFSVFGKVDATTPGKVTAGRGPKMANPRDLSVQAWAVVNAPFAQAVAEFQRWDALPHPELGNYLSGKVSASPSASDFSALAGSPGNSYVKAFDAATAKLPAGDGTLQLAAGDGAKYASAAGSKGGALGPKAVAFWSQILAARSDSFLQGGLAALPAYQTPSGSVSPAAEVARLLAGEPALRKQFSPLIQGPKSAQLTWTLFKTEKQAAVALVAAWSKTAPDTWQRVSVNCYASGGYYALLEFTQFWPITSGGKAQTLIWRGEAISSEEIAALHGVERMGASATTMREVRRSLESFVQSVK
jgi:hypothetical protein